MPSIEQLRSRLLNKLSELFRLDQPDIDFGFYRIMKSKAAEIQKFIDIDLLKIVAEAFAEVDEAYVEELKNNYEQALHTAIHYGVSVPERSAPVQNAKAAFYAVKNLAAAEADVYEHLCRFFERYYDNGDFISRRYYTRESDGKAAPFALPYNGEEVKLHWANADQYYVKSADYFNNFTFDLQQSNEIRKMSTEERALSKVSEQPLKAHFRIVDASEGEHGNVKTAEQNKRFFILHAENPITFNAANELVVNFEYRPDPERVGQDGTWREKRNAESVKSILSQLEIAGKDNQRAVDYQSALQVYAPTESDKKRPLLAKYLNQYTSRNSMDYFIHKDLGAFLRRELDFYIKNEIMQLDNIEDADAPMFESYLRKIKVLRKIAGKLIDFLAQLEDFQKKLWLKKKFVVETNYCITLDRVPEELYAEVAANQAQCEEWIKLFAIDEIQGDLLEPSFSKPLTVEFLKANNKLVLDTCFFDQNFKERLLATIENFDQQCDGLLIHSENFQALNLLQERYREQVKCIYIDPPYNTGGDGFSYKDSYQHSSWLSFLFDRIYLAKNTLSANATFFSSIDFVEEAKLRLICDEIFADDNFLAKIIWEKRFTRSNNAKLFSTLTENILAYRASSHVTVLREPRNDKADSTYSNPDNDPRGPWTSVSYVNPASKEARPNLAYPLINPITEEEVNHPTNAWKYEKNTYSAHVSDNRLYWGQEGGHTYPRLKKFLHEMEGMVPVDLWKYEDTGTTDSASKLLEDEFGSKVFEFPKPPALVERIIELANFGCSDGIIMDFFAGTAPTAHATINLNRADDGKRKYLLVEMGDYFDTVLKPRIAKVIYSENWKDGKPTSRDTGLSHCFKYLRLESYEDTLNNLRFEINPLRDQAVAANSSLKEDYMLHYMLDVETRGSQSLLNIDEFADPSAYTLEVKKPGSDEYAERTVDLLESFNYLLGLRVTRYGATEKFTAVFKRIPDPELPKQQHTKLVVDDCIRRDKDGAWWFRAVEGWLPQDQFAPNNGLQDKVLIIWRKLTADIEQDNLMLDEWFKESYGDNSKHQFNIIYVNGSNNLPILKKIAEKWKVRLIEEEFHKRMWEAQ